MSLSFGLFAEGVFHQQTFDTLRLAGERRALGASVGGLLAVERHLGLGLALRLEGGPVTGLFSRAPIREGLEQLREWATPLTWWGAGGLVWRH